jgi:peptide/nickel transport system permease protein
MENKRTFYIGLYILIFLAFFSILGQIILNYESDQQDLFNIFANASLEHPLGTDQYGRDVLIRVAQATQLSFFLALITTVTAFIPGVTLGILAAYKGGLTDKFLNIICDILLALPGLLLVLVLIAFSPGDFLPLYVGLALILWIEFFKITRLKTKSLLVEPFVESSKSLGFSFFYILRKLIIPKLLPMIFTISTFSMSTAIIAISSLSAINVGIRPPTAELGSMIIELLPYYEEEPLLVLLPSLIIFLIVLSLQLMSKRSVNA